MKTASREELQILDKAAIEQFHIDSLMLMENAGRCVAGMVFDALKEMQGSRVNVVCGKGNNGGDGFVCARYLIESAVKTNIFLMGKLDELKEDAMINFNRIKDKGVIKKIADLAAFEKFKDSLGSCDLFIDAIFGIGLKGQIKEPYKSVIKFLNNTGKQIISVDTPSGLDVNSGEVLAECIKAKKTVTFSVAKTGFYVNQGPSHCGDIIVVDIGIPKYLIDKYVR